MKQRLLVEAAAARQLAERARAALATAEGRAEYFDRLAAVCTNAIGHHKQWALKKQEQRHLHPTNAPMTSPSYSSSTSGPCSPHL